jgi:hypothetical protein
MTDRLDIAMLYRPPVRATGGGAVINSERHTIDFSINGISLFTATTAYRHDLCGCFSPDYATCGNELARNENERIAKIFSFESPSEIGADRVALFVCPQCGDLACGAITFQLSRVDDTVRWSHFAYENGYDEAQTDFESYSAIGPFEFAFDTYSEVIRRASSSRPMGDG